MRAHALGRRIVAPGMGAGVDAPDEVGEVHKTRFMQAVYTAQFFYALHRLRPVSSTFMPFYAGPKFYACCSHDGISFSISSRRMSEMERRLLAA